MRPKITALIVNEQLCSICIDLGPGKVKSTETTETDAAVFQVGYTRWGKPALIQITPAINIPCDSGEGDGWHTLSALGFTLVR